MDEMFRNTEKASLKKLKAKNWNIETIGDIRTNLLARNKSLNSMNNHSSTRLETSLSQFETFRQNLSEKIEADKIASQLLNN
jgi:hypothetical protein